MARSHRSAGPPVAVTALPAAAEPLHDTALGEPAVRGFLHRPVSAPRAGLVLTHGAGSDCNAPLLVALAAAFAARAVTVLRCDLPYRQARRTGPPHPGSAALDRTGLKRAVALLRRLCPSRIFLGGQSYGGRQASMLAAEEPQLADALVLLSYPLHPPGKPAQLRTAHFPALRTPALFVSGDRDEFGTPDELKAAIVLITARTEMETIKSAGHDLKRGSAAAAIADRIHRFLL